MVETHEGYVVVRCLKDLENPDCGLFVYAICPKCKNGWTSLYPNAELVIKNGFALCNEDQDWKIGILPSTNTSRVGLR